MSPGPLHDALAAYFQGEKIEALVFILPLGLASLVFGGFLFTSGRDAFSRGVALPCLVLGLLLAVVGGIVGFRTPSQVAKLESALASTPREAVAAEQARMAGVNRAWPVYLTVWALFAVGGLVLRFGLSSDLARGVGVALVFYAGVGLLIDGFAERRAQTWTEALNTASSTEAR